MREKMINTSLTIAAVLGIDKNSSVQTSHMISHDIT